MNTTKLYSCLLLLISWTGFIPEASAQEAEFTKLSKTFTLHQDGSQEFRCNKELKLFTHTAMNSTYGETFIVYNPDFQELVIHTSYTKQKDGTIIKTPDNAFVEVLPRFAADAPAFNQLKEMVVVHTGLDLGSTIFLDYSILTKAGFLPGLEVDVFLQETSPVREYQVSIALPAKETLNSILYASGSKAEETTSNGMKTYRWVMKNIPASSRMPFLPQNKENSARLVANTFTKEATIFTFITQAISKSVSIESETFARFITENCSSDKEKADIIHKHVVKNMSTVSIPQQYNGYLLRNSDDVLRSAYGTELEKAVLLDRMLNAVNIPSEVILFFPSTIQTVTGGLASIKEFGVKTGYEGEVKYLSATTTSLLSPELRGELDHLFTLSGEKLTTESKPAIQNETIEINLDGMTYDNGYLVYTLPSGKGIDKWNMGALNNVRDVTFELPSLLQEKITYIISVPEGIKLASPTEPIVVNSPYGKMSRTITAHANGIEVVCSIELNKQQFSVNEYPSVQRLIAEWHSSGNKQLLFKNN